MKSKPKSENWQTYESPNCGHLEDIDVVTASGDWHHRWKAIARSECGELMEPMEGGEAA